MRGVIVPTKVNEEVAKAQKEYEGMPVEITIEKMGRSGCFPFGGIPMQLRRA
jgi:hypothetical protein